MSKNKGWAKIVEVGEYDVLFYKHYDDDGEGTMTARANPFVLHAVVETGVAQVDQAHRFDDEAKRDAAFDRTDALAPQVVDSVLEILQLPPRKE